MTVCKELFGCTEKDLPYCISEKKEIDITNKENRYKYAAWAKSTKVAGVSLVTTKLPMTTEWYTELECGMPVKKFRQIWPVKMVISYTPPPKAPEWYKPMEVWLNPETGKYERKR